MTDRITADEARGLLDGPYGDPLDALWWHLSDPQVCHPHTRRALRRSPDALRTIIAQAEELDRLRARVAELESHEPQAPL